MGRKRKGRAISGWMIVDKPAGLTSTAVVNKIRWALGAAKAGHAGTLDPAATGLSAVAVGEATKTIPHVTDALKAYEFTVNWGAATNTDDAEGEVIATSPNRPNEDAIKSALSGFVGDIMQIPPKFSAVKIDGQRAYKLARDGQDVTITPRPLWVESLLLLDSPSPDQSVLELTCGKGGYVRSIARDLGEVLGCYGHVDHLRRIWSGPFDLTGAVTLDQVEELAKTPDLDAMLRPIEDGLRDLPHATTTAEGARKLANGNPAVCFGDMDYGDDIWVSHQGFVIALGQYKGGECHPSRIIHQDPAS